MLFVSLVFNTNISFAQHSGFKEKKTVKKQKKWKNKKTE
jgi:hypothetical protein